MKLNERLKQLRLDNHMTQKELANKLGISIPTLQKYEYGTLNLKREIIIKICKVFDIEVNTFFDNSKLSDDEKTELDFINLILKTDHKQAKDNMNNINFILDNARLNFKNWEKYLLYVLANNQNIKFSIEKNKKVLEINFYSDMLNSEAKTFITSENLKILLNMLDKNIQLALYNFLEFNKWRMINNEKQRRNIKTII